MATNSFDVKTALRKVFHAAGYEIHKHYPTLDAAFKREKIAVLLDVGANNGQAARLIRRNGFQGRIISFEPQSDAHAKLSAIAQGDPLWTIAPRCAVGGTPGSVEIKLAGNSESSSILNMLDRHQDAVPVSAYVGKESVEVVTLDGFLDTMPDLAGKPMALKMDTQGYEKEVLAGLQRWSNTVKVVHTEMSLVPLYDGEPTFRELYGLLEDRGYRCISIEPAWADPKTQEIMQVDAVFELGRG